MAASVIHSLRLRAVDRAHEAADRQKPQRRRDAPRQDLADSSGARCAVAGAWPSMSRICSPNSGSAIIGSEISSAAHSPTRSARRTRRGLRAPNACAASGATAETSPMPKVKVTKNTVCASAAAATASSPSRPISARSVVMIAICPSWVSRDRHGELEGLGQFEGEAMGERFGRAGRRCRRFEFGKRCHRSKLA